MIMAEIAANNEGKSVITEKFIRTLKKKKLQRHDFNIKICVY